MDIQEFVQNFAEQFDETDATVFNIDTRFRDIEEWSSLTALSIIAMADEIYNVKLTGDEIRKSSTLLDVYNIINSKL